MYSEDRCDAAAASDNKHNFCGFVLDTMKLTIFMSYC